MYAILNETTGRYLLDLSGAVALWPKAQAERLAASRNKRGKGRYVIASI